LRRICRRRIFGHTFCSVYFFKQVPGKATRDVLEVGKICRNQIQDCTVKCIPATNEIKYTKHRFQQVVSVQNEFSENYNGNTPSTYEVVLFAAV